MPERGVIYNRSRATQVRNFSGLRWNNITPTDIDGFIDFGGKAFVLMEFKHGSAQLLFGQKLAIERMVDTWSAAGVNAIALIARHNDTGDIDCANSIVVECRWQRHWRTDNRGMTVRNAIDGFLRTIGLSEYISGSVA